MNKTMFYKLIFLPIMALLSVASWSCADEEPSIEDVTGSWYGTCAFSNGTYSYLTVELNRNGTGSTRYEAPGDRISISEFVWEKKGNKIECNGIIVRYTGDVDDFDMQLEIEGDRLYPKRQYESMFILTRDDSVITYDGIELEDNSTDLSGVWINDNGADVLVLDVNEDSFYDYYTSNCEAGQYYWLIDGDLSYNNIKKEITLEFYDLKNYDFINYTIQNLTSKSLTLKSSNGKTLTYTKGSKSDVPTKFTAYALTLQYPSRWKPKSGSYYFCFYNGTILYSDQKSHNSSMNYLDAVGSYTISGNKIYAHFDQISISYPSLYPNDFTGWTNGGTRDIVYQIDKLSTSLLSIISDSGSTMTLYPE